MTNPNQSTAPSGQPIIINNSIQKKKVRHGFHAVMTVVTFGVWLPVWVIVAIAA